MSTPQIIRYRIMSLCNYNVIEHGKTGCYDLTVVITRTRVENYIDMNFVRISYSIYPDQRKYEIKTIRPRKINDVFFF